MDDYEIGRAISKALAEVCRRIGHDYADWRNARTWDGKPYEFRCCRTCSHEQVQKVGIEQPRSIKDNGGKE